MGTLRRKQQVRQFLENMPKDDHDDIFTLATMRNKAFEVRCPVVVVFLPNPRVL